MSAGATPYHEASVAAYCSTEAVGIQRPRLSVSLGPLSCSTGNTVPFGPGDAVEVAAAHRAADHEVVVAPGVIRADARRPVPAGCSVRPKSDSVKVVTCCVHARARRSRRRTP